MQEQRKERSWQALRAYDFLLDMFARHALLLVMFTKIDRKNLRVQSLRETFFFFVVIKTYAVMKAHNMETCTNQADELYRQANEIKHPPPYTSRYETMMEQQQLLSQAREMESATKDIKTQLKKVAASGLTIPSSTLLRKAINSEKNEKIMFCMDQLSKVVNLLMGNLPHILFRPISDTKET